MGTHLPISYEKRRTSNFLRKQEKIAYENILVLQQVKAFLVNPKTDRISNQKTIK
jgi:hypothetical protein